MDRVRRDDITKTERGRCTENCAKKEVMDGEGDEMPDERLVKMGCMWRACQERDREETVGSSIRGDQGKLGR